jgi:hypothetical protein
MMNSVWAEYQVSSEVCLMITGISVDLQATGFPNVGVLEKHLLLTLRKYLCHEHADRRLRLDFDTVNVHFRA